MFCSLKKKKNISPLFIFVYFLSTGVMLCFTVYLQRIHVQLTRKPESLGGLGFWFGFYFRSKAKIIKKKQKRAKYTSIGVRKHNST